MRGRASRLACAPMRRTLLHFLLLTVFAVVARAGEWTLYKVGGRDHVSLDNVAYVLNRPDFADLEPLKFYILRNNEPLFGHLNVTMRK